MKWWILPLMLLIIPVVPFAHASVYEAYTKDFKARIYFSHDPNPISAGQPTTLTFGVIDTSKYNWAAEDGEIIITDDTKVIYDKNFESTIGVIPVDMTFPHKGHYFITVTIWNLNFHGSDQTSSVLSLDV